MATNVQDERLLTITEVAQLLAVSPKTIRRLIAAGDLPAVQLGRKGASIRIPADEFDQWLYGSEEGAA